MTESKAQKVERLAEQGMEKAARADRQFTITKFSRHEDGYLHARVTPAGGKTIYVFRRYGSWQAPGTVRGQAMMKDVTYDVAVELQTKARAFERAEREAKLRQSITPIPPMDLATAARLTYEVFGRSETERALAVVHGLNEQEICSIVQHIETSLKERKESDGESQEQATDRETAGNTRPVRARPGHHTGRDR